MTCFCILSERWLNKLNPILPRGAIMAPPAMNPSATVTRSELTLLKFLNLFLLIIAMSQKVNFGVYLSKNWKKWTSKNFGGPRALGENQKILKFFIFLLTNPAFSSSIWIVYVLSFHLRCIIPLKLKILKILTFSTKIHINWNLLPYSDQTKGPRNVQNGFSGSF